MTTPPLIEQIAERVERLLVRHEELQRTNDLLALQIQALTQERDSLQSRLHAARARVDALIDRLPTGAGAGVARTQNPHGGSDSPSKGDAA